MGWLLKCKQPDDFVDPDKVQYTATLDEDWTMNGPTMDLEKPVLKLKDGNNTILMFLKMINYTVKSLGCKCICGQFKTQKLNAIE
jgi:hypothetical protein